MAHRYPESAVFHRPLGRPLPAIARGEGALLWDEAGKRYIDGSGGAVVVNVGHGRTEIADAMARQAESRGLCSRDPVHERGPRGVRASSRPARSPRNPRLYLVSGGSEANETAVKMARAYQLAVGQAITA